MRFQRKDKKHGSICVCGNKDLIDRRGPCFTIYVCITMRFWWREKIAHVVGSIVYVKFFFLNFCENVCSIKGESNLLELLKICACGKIARKKRC